jgi:AraC-like DNA-binding protein
VAGRPAEAERVRDRIDREYERPLDVEALARGAHMSAGRLSRRFRLAYGESPYSYLMTGRIERALALRDGRDPPVRREAGEPSDQESRSSGAAPRLAWPP